MAHKFEPILLLQKDEPFDPVDPKRYLEACALWEADPKLDDHTNWGKPPRASFPRQATIPKGMIAGEATETAGGRTFLGTQLTSADANRELWLEFSGWADADDVTSSTANDAAGLDKAKARVLNEPALSAGRFWYYAEILDTAKLIQLAQGERDPRDFPWKVIGLLFNKPTFILYYLLFPGHRADLGGCQGLIAGDKNGDYGGDWGCVAVLLENDQPSWIGTSVRNDGLLAGGMVDQRFNMVASPWASATLVDGHPKLFVADGTHSIYLTGGTQAPTACVPGNIDPTRSGCGGAEGAAGAIQGAVDKANGALSDADTAKDWVVLAAKVVAGGVLGGWIGAFVGLVAGIIEALTSSPDTISPPSIDTSPPPPDVAPSATANDFGRAILPNGVTVPEPVSESDNWAVKYQPNVQGREYTFIVDRSTQIWWPRSVDEGLEGPGYGGRWGPRVQKDRLGRRCGMSFPDYRGLFIRAILCQRDGI